MKHIAVVICLFLVLVTLLGRSDICKAAETNAATVEKTQMQTDYQELFNARTLNDILKQSEHWTEDFSPSTRNAFCLTLLDCLRSNDMLVMDEQGNRSTTHDLRMVGGRCAWALEKLLKCDLPPVTAQTTQEEMAEIRRLVIQTMSESKDKESIKQADDLIKSASLSQKRELARGANASPYVLAQLADEEDVITRRSVATNRKTPPYVLARLGREDADDEVRSLAVKNLEVSKTGIDRKNKKGK